MTATTTIAAARGSTRSTLAVLLGSLLVPVLPLLWFISLNRPPEAAVNASIALTGPWRITESSAEGLGALDVDDTAWPVLTLPGSFQMRGYPGQHHWLRRTVEWNGDTHGESLFLLLGNIRNGMAQLHVNGEYVGRNDSLAFDHQTDWTAVQGWEVPARLVRPGPNLLAVRVYWHEVETDGIFDQRMLLGPARVLQPLYARIRTTNSLFSAGAFFLCAFLVVLLGALLLAVEKKDRPRFASAFFVAMGAAFYGVEVTGNVGIFLEIPLRLWSTTASASMAGLTAATWNFAEQFFVGRVTTAQKANWVVSAVMVVAVYVDSSIFLVHAAYIGLPLAYLSFLAVRGLWRSPRGMVPLVSFSLLCIGATTVSDLLGNFALSDAPTLFPQSVTNFAVIASATIMAEFIQMGRRNQVLSSSLAVTNSDLATALTRAQESTRLKGDLLATVSHELRTPLNAIVNLPIGLLEDFPPQHLAGCKACGEEFEFDPAQVELTTAACPGCSSVGQFRVSSHTLYTGEPAETARFLNSIHGAGQHLLSVVNDILDYSKLNASRLSLSPEPVALPALLADVMRTVEPLARARGVLVDAPQVQVTGTLTADPLRLSQVLLNLLGNAIKFSRPDGHVVVRVTQDGTGCVFSVQDQGIGIAPEHQKVIFDSFRQVDGSNTREFGGTGLGLSIARELVHLHGGTIAVESTLGQGSTFTFRIPMQARAAQPVTVPAGGGEKSILIVEDDATTLETLKLSLRPLGCNLVGTTDPRSALQLLKDLKPALVILDVMLPHQSGLEVLRRLRSSSETEALPVMVTSADHTHREAAEALGAAWVPKPWNDQELLQAAARLVGMGAPAAG